MVIMPCKRKGIFMGYSATKKAFDSLEALMMQRPVDNHASSNLWDVNGTSTAFYEIGREQDDGAITGKVSLCLGNTITKQASFRIEPDGRITRFPWCTERMKVVVDASRLPDKKAS